MKRLSVDIIPLVCKMDGFDTYNFNWENEEDLKDLDKIFEAVNGVYPDFFEDITFMGLGISDEPRGEHQGNGDYCDQYAIGLSEDSFSGTYYFPIENGQYLAIAYEC